MTTHPNDPSPSRHAHREASRPAPRRRALRILLALVLLPLPCAACGGEASPARPDILLITVDSLRADRPGFMGGPVETPAMDRLASGGAVFTQVLSPAPQTLPSLASLHTGRYPPSLGVRDDGIDRLPDRFPTLASILAGEGYSTAAFAAALALHPKHGLDRGFESYRAAFADAPRPRTTPAIGIPAPRIADLVLEWLGEREEGESFFLWVNFFDPHFFYEPPAPFRERYQDQPYDGEIALVDREVGRLLGWLEDHGRVDRTLVVLAGNHGEGLGEGGERYHGILLREATLRVPLVIRGGGVAPGRLDDPVSLVDVAPTLLELAGASPPAGVEGTSLAAAARGEGKPPAGRNLYFETTLPGTLFGWSPLRGVRAGSFKYVEAPGAGWAALYDLAGDPAEETDLSGSRADLAAELAREAERIGGPAPLPREAPEGIEGLGLSTSPPAAADRLPYAHVETGNAALQAHRSLRRRMTRAADFLLKEVLREDPGNTTALLDTASILMGGRRLEEAREILTKAQALHPGDGEIYHLLGHLDLMAAQRVEDLDRSRRMFEIAVQLFPLNEEALYDLACATAANEPKVSLDYLERAVENGFRDYRHMARDADLNPIRQDPRFAEITGGRALPPEGSEAEGGAPAPAESGPR